MQNLEFSRDDRFSSTNQTIKHLFSSTKNKNTDSLEIKIPKGTIPLFDESYAQWKVLAKNGPEFNFHVSKNDVLKIAVLHKRRKNPDEPDIEAVKEAISKVEESISSSIEKMGVKKDVLTSALASIGFKSYTDFADALLTMSIEAYEKGTGENPSKKKIVNADGSLDIRQPLYFLIQKNRWIAFGDEWFKLPVREEKTPDNNTLEKEVVTPVIPVLVPAVIPVVIPEIFPQSVPELVPDVNPKAETDNKPVLNPEVGSDIKPVLNPELIHDLDKETMNKELFKK